MKTAENIKKVALIFFIIFGFAHIFSGLMASQGYGLPLSNTIHRLVDIPFATTAVIYGLMSIKTKIKLENKGLNIAFIAIALLIFGGLIYINLLVPDRIIR